MECRIRTEENLRYYEIDGKKYYSVTSILAATLEKPELDAWRAMVGKEEADRIARERAVIGSVCHYRILSKYSIRQLEPPAVFLPWKEQDEWLEELSYRAELCEMMWQEAVASIDLEPLYVEHTLVSHKHRFAGTFDMLAKIFDKDVLIDLKTSKELWEEYRLQLGAYAILCRENGINVDVGMLVKLHPFEEDNPSLKAETVWLNGKELDNYGEKFLTLVREFYEKESCGKTQEL